MKSSPVVLGIASFAVILLAWESVVRLGWVNPFFVSQPSAVAASLSRAARSGELGHNLAVSFREFVIGYGLSVVVGILAGALAGRFRTVEYALDPFLWFLYSAPLIASLGAAEGDLLWKVVLPASVPMMIAGLRLGIGRALMGVVVGELFGATAGLGYSISYYGALLKTTDMIASLVVIVVLGVLCTQGLSALEARFDSWRVDD